MDKWSYILIGGKGLYIYFYISKDENGVVIPETMRYFIDGGTEGFNG